VSASARVGAFLAVLVLVFGIATLVGRAAPVSPRTVEDAASPHGALTVAPVPVALSLSAVGGWRIPIEIAR
jgi:hypothetical protein